MALVTCLAAAIGYGFVYAAIPDRLTFRARAKARTLCLLTIGVLLLVCSAVLGSIAFGLVVGPSVALTAALTAGSAFVLLWPLVSPDAEHSRSHPSTSR